MMDPVLFVIDDDPAELAAFERALRRRYGADYRVIAERSPEAGLERLGQLASRGEDVALVVADQWLPGTTGVDVLARAHALHPHARRALLVAPGDVAANEALVGATALGRLDYYLSKHWEPPDEYLFPVLAELLADWYRATRRSTHEMARVVGRRWDARGHELRDLLERNAVPYGFYDAESEEGRALLRELGQDGSRLPVVTTYDGRLLVDPSNDELAAALGARTRPGPELYDLVIVGAGPAGLSAAVYGASEGLRTLVLEPEALGGQAGTSSLIRNYLGFPHGISGGMLMSHAGRQARLFGAAFVYNRAAGLERRGRHLVVRLAGGGEAAGRAVLVATGVSYRRLGVPELDGLLGAGVFYGAALSEAHAMGGQAVYVVGAGNSAGQAALHLARHAARVTILARGDSLGASMSDYLIREIGATPNIAVRLRTRVVAGGGTGRLERLALEDRGAGATEEVRADALFVLIGAEPRTDWLDGAVARDEAGYLLTGADLVPGGRPARLLETSLPGVFAAGDVRHGSVKRVASAVGEGSIAIRFVHQLLAT